MANKFGKFLLFTAAVGTAAAAAYYFTQKKAPAMSALQDDDDDYDDFSEDLDDDTEVAPRNYVSLNLDSSEESMKEETSKEEEAFTPLAEQIIQTVDKVEETVEEFFDEEDSADVEPPITDN